MPFYQMLCIAAHYPEYRHIKDLVRLCAKHVMEPGGVVRSIDYYGTRTLPQRMHRHAQYFTTGDYWTMHFDTNPATLRELNRMMRQDPRVIRWTMLKLGDKVDQITGPKAKTISID
ncbi:hypothetical protein JAAARDRAFT_72542 [Jaapia argillacea MUCL 33604]|uniref:Ribosomal protein S6 n=1 Tax=Jaapia argillacea MUCL 33604 TaxID=933084 RepID=A0A067PID4_9AGAM|nr:hypothetical protein JAAARDRAFT_72542 [Jaapia argillacea MUCL 33604]